MRWPLVLYMPKFITETNKQASWWEFKRLSVEVFSDVLSDSQVVYSSDAGEQVLPAKRWRTPIQRAGVRLRQRQAKNPVRPANTTKPRDTSGSRNWHLHRSSHTDREQTDPLVKWRWTEPQRRNWLNVQVRSMSSPLLWFPGSLYFGVNCSGRVKFRHSTSILASGRINIVLSVLSSPTQK